MQFDEIQKVTDNMERYGGSFVQTLATLILRADTVNLDKIRTAFPEYWNKYRDWGK